MPPLDDGTTVSYENRIPEAVRRASARADELAREAGATGVPAIEPPPDPPAGDPPSEAPPVGDPPADPSAATTTTVVAPPADPAAEWEQRYRTLQGKFDSEVPGLRGQIASLERVIAAMQVAAPAPAAAPAPPVEARFDPADVETYGQDLIDASRRWAKVELQSELKALRDQIASLESGHRQIETQTVQQRVTAALDADGVLAGRWRQLNNDPQFLGWLAQLDPFSGQPRMDLMRTAFAQGDAERTGVFFKTFLAEHTATSLPPASVAAPQTPPAGAESRPTLEGMAAPGRASLGGAPGGAPAEKRVWTPAEIAAFYRARTSGKYAGREAESVRLENDIVAAAREGRIRQ